MTFQSDPFPPHTGLNEVFPSLSGGHVDDNSSLGSARSDTTDTGHQSKREQASPLQSHLENANNLLSENEYNAAVDEYKQAAQRYERYRDLMKISFEQAIHQLSSIGCRATPPHPKTIELVRIQNQINS